MAQQERGERRRSQELAEAVRDSLPTVRRWAIRCAAVACAVVAIAGGIGLTVHRVWANAHVAPDSTYTVSADPVRPRSDGSWSEHVDLRITNPSRMTVSPTFYVVRVDNSLFGIPVNDQLIPILSWHSSVPCALQTNGQDLACTLGPHVVADVDITYAVGVSPNAASIHAYWWSPGVSGPTWKESLPSPAPQGSSRNDVERPFHLSAGRSGIA